MQIAVKQHRRRRSGLGGSQNSCSSYRAVYKNHVWSYDFVSERTEDGRQLKILVVIDEYTRECLALEVGRSFKASAVINVLEYLFEVRGAPENIRSDNGPEFISKEVRKRLARADVQTLFIAKSSPWENGYVESFNGKLGDELLNRELFLSLTEASWVLDRWKTYYNQERRHSALKYQTPAAFAANCSERNSATLHSDQNSITNEPENSHSEWYN